MSDDNPYKGMTPASFGVHVLGQPAPSRPKFSDSLIQSEARITAMVRQGMTWWMARWLEENDLPTKEHIASLDDDILLSIRGIGPWRLGMLRRWAGQPDWKFKPRPRCPTCNHPLPPTPAAAEPPTP